MPHERRTWNHRSCPAPRAARILRRSFHEDRSLSTMRPRPPGPAERSGPCDLALAHPAGRVVALVRLDHPVPRVDGDPELAVGVEAVGWDCEEELHRGT